jgi:hypothetical protein
MSNLETITIWPPDTDEEKFLKGELARVQEEYRLMAKPFVDRLVAINKLKVPKYYIVPEPPKETET